MAGDAVLVSPEMTDDEYNRLVGLHKPGSIKRLKCKNFLTYSAVDIKCGPRYVALQVFEHVLASFMRSHGY